MSIAPRKSAATEHKACVQVLYLHVKRLLCVQRMDCQFAFIVHFFCCRSTTFSLFLLCPSSPSRHSPTHPLHSISPSREEIPFLILIMIFNHPSAYMIANARPLSQHDAAAQQPQPSFLHHRHCNHIHSSHQTDPRIRTRAGPPPSMIGGSEGPSWSPFLTVPSTISRTRHGSSHSYRMAWGTEEAEEPMPTLTQAQVQAHLQVQTQLPSQTLPTTRGQAEPSPPMDMALRVKEWLLKAELESKTGI